VPFRPNDFKAEPQPGEFVGPQMKGVVGPGGLPGFHTTVDFDTAITYAYAKVADLLGDLDDGIPDYPVVVTLDMAGLVPEPDWDAEQLVRETLIGAAKSALSVHLDIHEAMEWLVQDLDSRGAPANVHAYLEEHLVSAHATSRLRDVLETHDDPETLLTQIAAGDLSPDLLAQITGQFRYTTDISSDRIIDVTYVRPYWPTILSFEAADEGKIETIEAAGFTVVTEEDTLNFDMVSDLKTAWQRRGRQTRLFGESERLEYHGTSFRNLRRAAPDVPLPDPPPPFDPALAAE